MYGCPICEFSDETQDNVFDHILLEHGDEAIDMKPIELGEFEDDEAGRTYEKVFKREKIEKTEYKITPKHNSATFKRLESKIEEMQTQIIELQEKNSFLEKEINKIKTHSSDIAYQHAQDRQKMSIMENYLNGKKNSTRRDFDWFANELLKHMIDKILKHKRHTSASMDYKEIKLCLRFRHNAEAYRIMRDVMPLKHGDKVKFVDRGEKTRPRYLLVPKKSFADAVKSIGGYSPSLLGGMNILQT